MSKRANTSVAAPLAKHLRLDPNQAGVTEGINRAEQVGLLDATSAKMLRFGIPGAFGTPLAERHESQTRVVKMLEEVLNGVKDHLHSSADELSGKVSELEGTKGELDSKVMASQEAFDEAVKASGDAADAFCQADQQVKSTASELKGKRAAEKTAEKALEAATKAKDAFATGVESHFKPLHNGEFGPGGPGPHKAALLPLLEGAGVEESLFLAFPSSCAKAVSTRTSFDTMVFQAVAKAVETKQAALAQAEAEQKSSLEAGAAAVKAAEDAVTQADAAQKVAEETLEQTSAKVKELEPALKEAKTRVSNFDPDYAKATAARDEGVADLENFDVYNLGCLEVLRDEVAVKATTTDAEPAEGEAAA